MSQSAETSASGQVILVVDDSESVQTLSHAVLEASGFRVVGVTSGGEALRWLGDRTAALVLLDYRLPDMTGVDLLRILAEEGRKIPFVAITAHGDERIAVEMMKLGALDYLAKDNVFVDMLPAVVQQVLDHLEQERRLAAAEEAARESEGRFRSIFVNAAAGMATVSPTGKILQVNPAVCRFLGYAAVELLATDVVSISHPDDLEMTRRYYAELVGRERSAFSYEKRYLRKDGSTVWGQTTVAGVYDERGRLGYCVALLQDISGRKRYETLAANIERGVAIKTGDDFFRSLVECLGEALDADLVFVGECLAAGPERVRSIVVRDRAGEGENFEYALAGTPCADVLNRGACIYPSGVSRDFPEDRPLAEMGIEGYAGIPLFGSADQPLGLLVALFRRPIADVDLVESLLQVFSIRAAAELERRQGEMALRRSQQKYKHLSDEFQALLDGIPDVLLLLSRELGVIWANRAALRHFQGRLGGGERTCASFCGNGHEPCRRCPVVLSFASRESEEAVLKMPDGGVWGVKAFPLLDGNEQVSRVIMLGSDITEKIRLREEADRAGRLAAVGELAAGVAHEINNPVGLILMNLPVVKAAFGDALPILEQHQRETGDFLFGGLKFSKMQGQMPHLLDEILDGAQRIRCIVDDMKSFARGGQGLEGELSRFDLDAAVQRAVRLVGNQIRNATDRFSILPTGGLPLVRGNPQRIEQVLVNLILNACHALPEKGRVLEVATRFNAKLKLCQVTVRDEGVGIPEKDLAHLTDPFFTTRRESGGTGLGLSVSARIVREHGGSLQFSSSPGEGTTVTLSLPALLEEDQG